MRRAILWSLVPLATLVAAAASCGGSSSETPWPADPSPKIIAPGPDHVPASDDDAGARRSKE